MSGFGVSKWLVGTAWTGTNLVGGGLVGGGVLVAGGGGGGGLEGINELGSKMPMGSTTWGPCPLKRCLARFFRCFSSLISLFRSRSSAASCN